MRTEFLCISVLRVASGLRVKLANCKSALNPTVVYSTGRSKAMVSVLVLFFFFFFFFFFVALWFILRGDLFYVLPYVVLVFFSPFSIAITSHSALVQKYSVSLKTLPQQGISEPELYVDLVYRFRKNVGKSNFSEQFRKLINRYKRIGYSLDIMRQIAFLVVNPIIVDGHASLFYCTTAVWATDSMTSSS